MASTHTGVATVAVRAPLETRQIPTVRPEGNEVRILNQWTASTALSLHQADGGLLVKHPQLLGGNLAGTVVEVGRDVKTLKLNDKVFGYGFKAQKENSTQDYVTVPEYQLAKIPAGFSMREAVTLPDNFITGLNTLVRDFNITLPWPRPSSYVPSHADSPVLIWGGGSSSGQFAIQIFKYFGFETIITTASKAHHEALKELGATHIFDYRETDVVNQINAAFPASPDDAPSIPYIMDCIGSQSGALEPLSRIAQSGSIVASLLPVIIKVASEAEAPEFTMDVAGAAKWAEGVITRGVRTHDYQESQFLKDFGIPTIMPEMLASGDVLPNRQKIVEGATMLQRAQAALDMMRRKDFMGERLVWQISDLQS